MMTSSLLNVAHAVANFAHETCRRARLYLQASPFLARIAFDWCVAPRPDKSFEFGFDDEGRERQIRIDAFAPRQVAANVRAPAVVLLHGVEGSLRFASTHYLTAAALAKQGYAVYYVHYFNSVDYDDIWAFREDGQLDVATVEEICDRDHQRWVSAVLAALRVIGARAEVDPERIALFGYSLGCFISLSAAEEAGKQRGLPKIAAVIGNWGARFRAATFSQGFPPTRLFHGARDSIVLLEWARETLVSLQAAGADAALMEIPNQGHWATSRLAWRETLAFLKQRFVPRQSPKQTSAGQVGSVLVME